MQSYESSDVGVVDDEGRPQADRDNTSGALASLIAESAATDESQAVHEFFGLGYQQLRKLARRVRSGWHGCPTLGTTVLVHEAYIKLARYQVWSRGQFLALVARAMRQSLINYAEQQRAGKRGGAMRRTTLEDIVDTPESTDELLALDLALQKLERKNPRLGRVIECRFFAGLSVEETAEATATSPATVKRDWRLAQAWLRCALAGTQEGLSSPR